MITVSRFLAALAATAALAAPAFAQTAGTPPDFLTAPKVACAPESVTRCSGGQCTTRPASAKDKADILVIDFKGKKAAVRRGDGMKPFADIVDDEVSGEERRFALAESASSKREKLQARLSKAGKLSLIIGGDGSKAEAACTVES